MNILTTNNPVKYGAIQGYFGSEHHYMAQKLKTKYPSFVEDEEIASTAKKKCNELIAINTKLKKKADIVVAVEVGFHKNKDGYFMLYTACKYEGFKYNFGYANALRISKNMYEVAKEIKLQEVANSKDTAACISDKAIDVKKMIMECLFRVEKSENPSGKIDFLTVKDFSSTESFKKLDKACQDYIDTKLGKK